MGCTENPHELAVLGRARLNRATALAASEGVGPRVDLTAYPATPVPLHNLLGHEEPGAFFGSHGTSPWDHPAQAGFSNPANVILTLETVNKIQENCQF